MEGSNRKEVTVTVSGSLNLTFRRTMTGDKLTEWNKMTTKIAKVRLSSEADSFVWSLHSNDNFSVPSMYNAMLVQANYPLLKPLWKMKIPLKIKIFLWYLGKVLLSPKIICQSASGRAATNVVSVIMMKLFSTFSSTVMLLEPFGSI
jgi:hypothetical protein